MNTNLLKKLAAEKAVEEISSGMIVGLGSGSTFQFALEKISEKIKNGEIKNILCVPSSNNTEKEARRLGIPLTTFEELIKRREKEDVKSETEEGKPNENSNDEKSSLRFPSYVSRLSFIDITIDGADEVAIGHPEPDLSGEGSTVINLIKGGGGALLREKILAQASKRLIIVVDESKLSKHLGTKWSVPIEVIRFAASVEQKYLESLGVEVVRRKNADGKDYVTDENNFILDANFGVIKNVNELSSLLNQRAGIVEHGLFIGMTSEVICAMQNGQIKNISKSNSDLSTDLLS